MVSLVGKPFLHTHSQGKNDDETGTGEKSAHNITHTWVEAEKVCALPNKSTFFEEWEERTSSISLPSLNTIPVGLSYVHTDRHTHLFSIFFTRSSSSTSSSKTHQSKRRK